VATAAGDRVVLAAGEHHIALHALHDLQAGEELLFDYGSAT
jgi:hypothetical protein